MTQCISHQRNGFRRRISTFVEWPGQSQDLNRIEILWNDSNAAVYTGPPCKKEEKNMNEVDKSSY